MTKTTSTPATETIQYRIDADMLGDGFAGTTGDLFDFIPHLAAATGRPETDFLVQQHVSQWDGAEEPSEEEWLQAVEAFAAERPELFPESGRAEPTTHVVRDYDTADLLPGKPSEELIIMSDAVDDGAVLAYLDADGVWQWVPDSYADRQRSQMHRTVRTVYVDS